jgi:thiaminase/transcriptional activator TenA
MIQTHQNNSLLKNPSSLSSFDSKQSSIFNQMQNNVISIMHKINNHPFNQELAQGILPKQKFIFYIKQDALYLSYFAKALALTASRISDSKHFKQFIDFVNDCINAEQMLHAEYLNKFLTTISLDNEQSPACFTYCNYLLKMTTLASIEEAVASLLPCFWIYSKVGKYIASTQNKNNNQYQDWINLYASEEFESAVNAAINITNELGTVASDSIKTKMLLAFYKSAELEWMFWDSAYKLETWPLSIEK